MGSWPGWAGQGEFECVLIRSMDFVVCISYRPHTEEDIHAWLAALVSFDRRWSRDVCRRCY